MIDEPRQPRVPRPAELLRLGDPPRRRLGEGATAVDFEARPRARRGAVESGRADTPAVATRRQPDWNPGRGLRPLYHDGGPCSDGRARRVMERLVAGRRRRVDALRAGAFEKKRVCLRRRGERNERRS